jgi:positive regulator of sigma E activity
MDDVKHDSLEERSMLFTAVIYYLVMLTGLIIGLYGLISLFSLATSQVLRNQSIGSFI